MSDLIEITDEERAQLEHAAELLEGALSSPTGWINSTAMLAYDTLRSLANRKPVEPRATDPRIIMLSDEPRPFKADPAPDAERAEPDEREPRHSCPYGCEGDCDVPEHLRGQRDYFARVAELAQEQIERLKTEAADPQCPVGDGEVVLRLTRNEAEELADELAFESVPTPLSDKLRAALDQALDEQEANHD